VRWAGRILLTAGATLLVAGLVTNRIWAWGWILFWAGGTTFIAGGATFALLLLRNLKDGWRIFPGDLSPEVDSAAGAARDALITKLAQRELLAHVRTRINTMRTRRFDPVFSVTSSPGLNEIHDSVYEVPTHTASDVEALIAKVTGISLGISGPRGSGTSTILRHYCTPALARSQPATGWERWLQAWNGERKGRRPVPPPTADVRCVVPAPVDYAALRPVCPSSTSSPVSDVSASMPTASVRYRTRILGLAAIASIR